MCVFLLRLSDQMVRIIPNVRIWVCQQCVHFDTVQIDDQEDGWDLGINHKMGHIELG